MGQINIPNGDWSFYMIFQKRYILRRCSLRTSFCLHCFSWSKLKLTFNSQLKRSNLTLNYEIMKYERSINASPLILFASFTITLYYECKKCKQYAKGVMWLVSILYEICALKSKKSESKSQVHPNRHTINYLITLFTTGHQLVTNAKYNWRYPY